MRNTKHPFFIICLFFFGLSLYAQQDSNLSLYRHHLNTINPAVSGTNNAPYFNTSFRSQWSGIEGAPEIQAFSYETPTSGERVGLGVNIVNDRTFIERQLQSFVSFSYRLQLSDNSSLYLGIQGGFNAYQVNAVGLKTYENEGIVNDPNLIDFSRVNPNVGVGAYLKSEKFYLSVSAPRILKTERFKNVEGINTTASDFVHVYGSGGYFFNLNNSWDFIPSFLTRYVTYAPLMLVLNGAFLYRDVIEFGLEYNFQSGVGGTLMIDTQGIFSFGYAYVRTMHSEINQFSNGNHELVLKVRLKSGKVKDIDSIDESVDENEKVAGLFDD